VGCGSGSTWASELSPQTKVWLSRGVSAAWCVTACVHASALLRPSAADASPPWRHGLFLGINLLFAGLYTWRPWWLPYAFALLAVQQVWSHGHDLAAAHAAGLWDVSSLVVLLSIPLFAWVAWVARRSRLGALDTENR